MNVIKYWIRFPVETCWYLLICGILSTFFPVLFAPTDTVDFGMPESPKINEVPSSAAALLAQGAGKYQGPCTSTIQPLHMFSAN